MAHSCFSKLLSFFLVLICVVFCVGYSVFLLACFFYRLSKQTWTRRFSLNRVSWVQTRVFRRRSYSKHLLHEIWVSCRDNHLLLVCKSRFRDDMDLQSKGKIRSYLFMTEIWPHPWKIIRKQLLGGGSWIWTSHATAVKHFVRIEKVKKLRKWVPHELSVLYHFARSNTNCSLPALQKRAIPWPSYCFRWKMSDVWQQQVWICLGWQ